MPPFLMIRALGGFRNILMKLYRRLFPGPVVLFEQFQYFWLMQPLYVAAVLDIAGLLKSGPKKCSELATLSGAKSEPLYRVMRALASSGIFIEHQGGIFGLNSQSRALLEGDGSMRHVIIHHLGNINWNAQGNLLHTVRTGENAFAALHKKEIYEYLREDQDEMNRFEMSMAELSNLAELPILARYDFSGFKTIADIGGGNGFLLAAVLEKYQKARGTVFDLPENRIEAQICIEEADLSSRMTFKEGNFLEAIDLKADLYMLKNVLHNWNEGDCIKILRNLGKTMDKNSRLAILEMIIPKAGRPSYAMLVDIQMLATMNGGRERTLAEFESILGNSGFRLLRVIHTAAPLSVIEAERI